MAEAHSSLAALSAAKGETEQTVQAYTDVIAALSKQVEELTLRADAVHAANGDDDITALDTNYTASGKVSKAQLKSPSAMHKRFPDLLPFTDELISWWTTPPSGSLMLYTSCLVWSPPVELFRSATCTPLKRIRRIEKTKKLLGLSTGLAVIDTDGRLAEYSSLLDRRATLSAIVDAAASLGHQVDVTDGEHKSGDAN